ncbi:MAG: molybdopterin dinucleotide binding domain-containing protein, partial [Candidatus Binatia bacterium]|nr:molybdopterin dinucleotide binding domain-containing protein [Candidatus Binatia bacterium]
LDRFTPRFNSGLGLKEPYEMAPSQRYSVEEVLDRHIKSTLGEEHSLEELREKGFVAFPRTLAERFPRPLVKLPRVHLYFEFLLEAGEQLASLAAETKLEIDTRGFQALPCWHPCAAQVRDGLDYELIAVNYKLPFLSYTMTQDNPWLAELAGHHPYAYGFLLNAETAARRGIGEGDQVVIETATGARVQGIAKISQCVHPEVIGIASSFGHWGHARPTARRRGAHFNSLVPYRLDQIDPMVGLMDACVKVKVNKMGSSAKQELIKA